MQPPASFLLSTRPARPLARIPASKQLPLPSSLLGPRVVVHCVLRDGSCRLMVVVELVGSRSLGLICGRATFIKHQTESLTDVVV